LKKWRKLAVGIAAGLAVGLVYSFVSRASGST
jgi:xanthosine utilization system XapX-like protein